jgi:hypothetical protein
MISLSPSPSPSPSLSLSLSLSKLYYLFFKHSEQLDLQFPQRVASRRMARENRERQISDRVVSLWFYFGLAPFWYKSYKELNIRN